MTDQNNHISTTVDNETARRFENYRGVNDLKQSQAARKLIDKGLRDWEGVYGPHRSLLLYIAIAASAWAILAVAGFTAYRWPSFQVAGMTVYLALVAWTAYVVIVLRQYWGVRQLFRSGLPSRE